MPNDKSHIMKSVATVSTWTAVSRVLGFVREILMAQFFGTSLASSAFVVAFTVPNLFRRLFGEGALSAAFIPVFTETQETAGNDEAWRLANRIGSMLVVLLSSVVLVGITVISLQMNSGDVDVNGKSMMVLSLLRIMAPYMVCICLVALCMAVLNSCSDYTTPAATPVVLNIIWIITLLFVCPEFGDTKESRIYGVAWGVLVAGLVQVLIQLPALLRQGYRPRLTLAWKDARAWQVIGLMAPVAVGLGLTQMNVMIDRLLAMHIAEWAPSAINYADRLIYLPLGVFATAMGTVLLPTFSRQSAQKDPGAICQTLNDSLRHLLFIMMPASMGLLVLARPVIELVYEWPNGAFDSESAKLTARALMMYAPGLLVFSIYKVVTPVFFALKDTRTPVIVGALVVGLNLGLNLAIVFTSVIPVEWKHAGLACTTVLSSLICSIVLAVILHRRLGNPGWARIANSLLRSLLCAVAMAVVVWRVYQAMPQSPDKLSQVLAVVVSIGIGIVFYFGLTRFVCRSEQDELRKALRPRSK